MPEGLGQKEIQVTIPYRQSCRYFGDLFVFLRFWKEAHDCRPDATAEAAQWYQLQAAAVLLQDVRTAESQRPVQSVVAPLLEEEAGARSL